MDKNLKSENTEEQNKNKELNCKHCGERIEIKAENKGLRIQCPSCGLIFISPKEGNFLPKEENSNIKFNCKRCGEKIETAKENIGSRVECSSCGLTSITPECSDVFPQERSVLPKEEKLYLETYFDLFAILSGVTAFIFLIIPFATMGSGRGRFSAVPIIIMMIGAIINIFLCLGLSELVKYFRELCKNIEDIKNKK